MHTVTADGPPPVATYTWDGRGQLTHIQGAATLSTWTRDAAGQVTSVEVTSGAATRFARHYGYDNAGRRSYVSYGDPTTNPGGQAYNYDSRGQLTHAKSITSGNPATTVPTVNPTHQFSFDPSGNRQSVTTPALGTVNYTADSTNAYTMITGDQPTHDANGNTTSLRGRTLEWDRSDRLRSNGNVEYTYDALGRVVLRKDTTTGATRRFTWSGWLMLNERREDSAGNETETLRYTWGADLAGTLEATGAVGGLLMIERFAPGSSNASVAHVHPDANGNTMGTTSSTGATLTWHRHHPFGMIETEGGNANWLTWNRFKFSTKYLDEETGLYYYGYRYYDPVTGRWINRDPIEEDGGLNLYAFVGNHAVNSWDYLGLRNRGPGIGGPRTNPNRGTANRIHPDNTGPVEIWIQDPINVHCFNEGWMRHCVSSCKLAHRLGRALDILVQPAAQITGGDLPWQDTRDDGDVQVNQAGIDIARRNGRRVSCITKCREAFMQKFKDECCQIEGKEKLKKDDPDCCEEEN